MAIRRKRTGGRGKRITARQRTARRKNIAIARKYRKKGAAKHTSKNKKPISGRVDKRGRLVTTGSPLHKKKLAGIAFKKRYKELAKANKGQGMSKDWARRQGHTAAMKLSKVGGQKMARKYAMGVARKKFKMDRKGARQFASGYINSILRDLMR